MATEKLVEGIRLFTADPHTLEQFPQQVCENGRPPQCLVEINNRYVWRCDWRRFYGPFRERFRFVISSDAHQPNWLNQTVARYVASELGIAETLVFPP